MPFVDTRRQRLFSAHNQNFDSKLLATLGGNVEALLVADQNLCARILQREIHFIFDPPRVHRHRNSANRNNRRKRHNPLGIIAHRDSHSVAFFDAIGVHEQIRQRVNLIHCLGECECLTLVNQKRLFAVTACTSENLAQVCRGILEDLCLDPHDFGVDKFENLPCGSNCQVGFSPRHCHFLNPRVGHFGTQILCHSQAGRA